MIHFNDFIIYFTFLFTYIICSTYCLIYDLYFLKEKKINNHVINKNERINQYKKILPTVLLNMFITIPPIAYASQKIYDPIIEYEKFNIIYCILRLFIANYLIDFFFFTCHKLMHTKKLYKWSHKKHHEFKYPVGAEALYLHWLDLYIGNGIPLNLPILIIPGAHIYTWILWMISIIGSTVLRAHSSFNNNESHLAHHIYFNINFGTGMYMDKLFKTNKIPIKNN